MMNKLFRRLRDVHRIDEVSQLIPTGRDSFDYVEGDHIAAVNIERLGGNRARVIYLSTIRSWKVPYEKERLTEEKKKEILEKIEKYFEARGITYEVEK